MSQPPPVLTEESLQEVVRSLGIHLQDTSLLRTALTHRSYLGESTGVLSNERLEFLGDSVLGLIVSEWLYRQMEDWPEGELSKAKAVAVSEPALAEAAQRLGVQEHILLSTGERMSGGRNRASILSDTYEAIVAVVYLDQGLEAAREFIIRSLSDVLGEIEAGVHLRDYKSRLQQFVQGHNKMTLRYAVVSETGADHDKTFTVQVEIDGRVAGSGIGKSKKQAEQAAAAEALSALQVDGACVNESGALGH